MKRIAASLLAMALTVAPLSVKPLGMGEVDLRSHLNEPLDARIALLSLRGVDTDSIRVSLGTRAQFERAGIERPFILNSLSLTLKANGAKTHIQVSSREPIGEPFLNFLVEIDWPNGRTLREYTLLLDPPVYGAAITRHVKETVPTVFAPPTIRSARTQARQPRAASGGTSRATFSPGGTYGPVKSSDTLWSLADRFRPGAGVSIEQMMLAMLRYNPDAFLEGNVNLLREGAVLTIPSEAQAEELARSEALREVQDQHAAWRVARQMTSAASASTAAPATLGGAAPKGPMAAPAVKSDASGAPALEESRLKLVSRGDASGGVSATSDSAADVSALRSELDQAREEADVSRREAEELSARVEETEAIIEELERLAKVRDADLAALQQSISSAGAGAPANDASSAPMMMDPSPTEAKIGAAPITPVSAAASGAPPIKKTVPLPPPPKPSTGILDDIRNALSGIVPFDPLLLVGGGILAIVIAVVGIVFSRRREDEAEDVAVLADDDVTELAFNDDIAPDAAATVVDMPSDLGADAMETLDDGATSEEFVVEQQQQSTQGRQGEEDPLAEVNVYLAYERFEQAQGLVKDAIEKNPDRSDYKLKLLEIYHAAKNVAAFEAAALVLQEAV
ncbi:MAG: pilus assembly protein FimV, partial [Gammaproteobacteria bacterium]